MSIEVTARHMHATEALQDHASRKAQFLIEEFPQVEHIHIVLDHVRHQGVAEVVVQARMRRRAEAKETADSMKACIDAAFEKVERQLRRAFDKLADHKVEQKQAARRKRTT